MGDLKCAVFVGIDGCHAAVAACISHSSSLLIRASYQTCEILQRFILGRRLKCSWCCGAYDAGENFDPRSGLDKLAPCQVPVSDLCSSSSSCCMNASYMETLQQIERREHVLPNLPEMTENHVTSIRYWMIQQNLPDLIQIRTS